MKKRFFFLLIALLSLNLSFAGEETDKDTIRFKPGIWEYDMVLEGRQQLFFYDTLKPPGNYNCKIWIRNNSSETITISYVRSNSSGKMLTDLVEPDRNEEVKPGKLFCIDIRPTYRPGPLMAWTTIMYKTGGTDKEMSIYVAGYTIPMVYSTPPVAETKAEEQKPVTAPVQTKKTVTQTVKKAEPVVQQPAPVYYKQVEEGVKRFGAGELTKREHGRSDYSFALPAPKPKTSYGFSQSPAKELIFSWDTLTEKEFPLHFQLKNETGYAMTILKIKNHNNAAFYKNASNQVLLYPDSVLTIEAFPNLIRKGHFYEVLTVYYLSIYGVEQFELKQWGFIPETRALKLEEADSLELVNIQKAGFAAESQKKTAPIRVYVMNEQKSIVKNATLQLFVKDDKAIIRSVKDEQGNDYFRIMRNGWDTLFIHVLSPSGLVLEKTRLTGAYEYDAYIIPVSEVKEPYTYYYGKVPYKPLKGIYRIDMNRDYLYSDSVYIKKYAAGSNIRFLKNGSVEIKDINQAIALEKKLLSSPKAIHLYPVIEYRSGGGIEWYTNTFRVNFYENVSEKRVKEIFARYGISNYSKTGEENDWYFSMNHLLDRKYITLLDQLWQLKEVSGLTQERIDIAGEDEPW